MEDDLLEKKKEIEKEAMRKKVREWEENIVQSNKLFLRWFYTKGRKSHIYEKKSLGNVFTYYKEIEIPPLEVTGSLEEKVDMLPDIRFDDSVRDLWDDLFLENEVGDIKKDSDDLGDLFHISKAVECPDCQQERKEFRLTPEKEWICDSCYKLGIVRDGLEQRSGLIPK